MSDFHDCTQVERDNLDLHQALAESLRRMNAAASALEQGRPCLATLALMSADLAQVLERTSRPAAHMRPLAERWAR